MTDSRHWWRLPAVGLAALLTGALIACSGAGDSDSDTPTSTASATTAAEGTATGDAGDGFASQSPDSLTSYRYSVQVTLAAAALDSSEAPSGLPLEGDFQIEIVGEVVNPGREHSETSIDLGFLAIATETIRIDGQEWNRQAGGTWEVGTSATGADSLIGTDFSPASVFTTDNDFSYDELTARLSAHAWRDEDVEGVAARHYTFTQQEFYETFQTDQRVLPDDMDATFVADMWLAEDLGVPIKMVIVGTASDGTEVMRLELVLTDLNGDIAIEPPI
jgi:hypothetical protein